MNQSHFEQNGRTFVLHNMREKPVGVVKLSSRKFVVEYKHSLQKVTMDKKIRGFWRHLDEISEESAKEMGFKLNETYESYLVALYDKIMEASGTTDNVLIIEIWQ